MTEWMYDHGDCKNQFVCVVFIDLPLVVDSQRFPAFPLAHGLFLFLSGCSVSRLLFEFASLAVFIRL